MFVLDASKLDHLRSYFRPFVIPSISALDKIKQGSSYSL